MYQTLLMVALVAASAPLVASLVGRVVRIPVVVVEILLGLLVGPAALNLIVVPELVGEIADIGLVMLFFMAGTEIDFARIKGRPLRRSAVGWLISLGVGVLVGILLAPTLPAGVYVGIALSSTALGTLLPVLIDAGRLRTPFGIAVSAAGAIGEFGPLLAISIFLSGRKPGLATIVVLAFGVVALLVILMAARGAHHWLHGFISTTLHTSAQFAVRIVLLVIAALVALSIVLDLDMLLGAFASGVAVQFLLNSAEPDEAEAVQVQAGRCRVRPARAVLLHLHRASTSIFRRCCPTRIAGSAGCLLRVARGRQRHPRPAVRSARRRRHGRSWRPH